ncbi:CAP domain-containing protein [Deinococcus taeanensis]|uniref:CAP domain-containing protein n=1 Tax=Deinococcus taeanensis TaxID=2737050 RepID=UPI001CDB9755|nr:CAP domain-containing protein [Deinococcus taeanensis]UBV43265.1 CAP domain-containing protein [Deinococcus taeanensis]
MLPVRRASALLLLTSLAASLTSPGLAQASGMFRVGYSVSADHRAPLNITLQATAPAGYEIQWTYGDGAADRGLNVTHTYYRPGTYTLSATLLDAQGRTVSRAEIPVEVRSAGTERAELTILHAPGQLRLSGEGSVIYAASPIRLFLDGREIRPGAQPVTPGTHTAVAQATSSDGRTIERRLTVNVAPFTSSASYDTEVLRLTNQARAQGWNCDTKRPGGPPLPPLKADAALDVAAQAQSAAMALYGYFDHTSTFDGSTPLRRVQAAGLHPTSVAENIAAGQQSPQEVVDGWLRSPGHCRNIMGNFTLIGLSFVNRPGTTYSRYWTQVFARL